MRPFERPDHDPKLLQYVRMSRLVQAAGAVRAGQATVDTAVFHTIPFDSKRITWEEGGVAAERQDALYAFTTAFYAPGYGPAAAETIFEPDTTVGASLANWSNKITDRFNEVANSETFARVFFEGGLWKIFLDLTVPEPEELCSLLDRPDFGGLRHDPWMLDAIEQMRQQHLVRDDLPHLDSQRNIARFANTVLYVGEHDMQITDPDELTSLLERSLPEGEDIAFLSVIWKLLW